MRLEQYEEAIEDFTQAITIKPDDAKVYFERGKAKVSLKQYEEAIEDFTQAIIIKPDYAEAYFYRGLAKILLEQYEEAIEGFTQAITIKPDYAEAYWWRGLAHKEFSNLTEARRDLQEALHLATHQNNQPLMETLENLKVGPHRILTPLSQQGFSKGLTYLSAETLGSLSSTGFSARTCMKVLK